MLEEPQVAFIDCNDCVKWIYDLETGERVSFDVDGKKEFIPRVATIPPPCGSCPKALMGLKSGQTPSPDLSGSKSLNSQNYELLRMWHEAKATRGIVKVPKHLEECAIFAKNIELITRIHKDAETRNKIKLHNKAKG